ncbi:MAG: 23S rRNA (cytosine1962-C5)-methyltransferase [Myxococcota bacterium]|jgi:23S rRNA (cytosine1962-C5)-methyltransferase
MELIARAIDRRAPLLAALGVEDTDGVRLFHGVAEGRPGLTVDRYGPILLVQTNREPLEPGEVEAISDTVQRHLGVDLATAWNHRPAWREGFDRLHNPELPASPEVREGGLRFDARPRHRGLDPLLFLDFRHVRRRVRTAGAQSVLNLFAYTCGVSVAASAGEAPEVWSVDFAASSLDIGEQNATRNGVGFHRVCDDVFPVVRQLAGLPVGGRRGRRPRFIPLEERRFDLVVLDPPKLARGRWGAVDLVRDYASLFKPAVLCVAPGGVIVATNNVARVERDGWVEQLRRCAAKAGRELTDVEILTPDADFPSFDDRPPLKVAWCRVR